MVESRAVDGWGVPLRLGPFEDFPSVQHSRLPLSVDSKAISLCSQIQVRETCTSISKERHRSDHNHSILFYRFTSYLLTTVMSY